VSLHSVFWLAIGHQAACKLQYKTDTDKGTQVKIPCCGHKHKPQPQQHQNTQPQQQQTRTLPFSFIFLIPAGQDQERVFLLF
jgi:hypothetical protein